MKNAISITMAVVMGIFSFLTGCQKNKEPDTANTDITAPIPLPEGAHVTRLFLYRSGTAMGSYYILCEKEDGFYMKITDMNPEWQDWEVPEGEDERFYGADIVYDSEHAVSVKLTDEQPLREIEALIEKYGVLGLDGWKKERKLPAGQMDGDYYVRAYIELSDGTTVDMSGSNTAPKGWNDFHYETEKIFEKNAGYSRFNAADIP